MAVVLGINAVFHDPAAALVIDGRIAAAAEEERFSRRKHGKPCVPFSTWELPEAAAVCCLREAGLSARDVDVVAYSYDPGLAPSLDDRPLPGTDAVDALSADGWERLRTLYARRSPQFLQSTLEGISADRVHFVPHHVAHAASAYLASGFETTAVLVLDGRGEATSHLCGVARHGVLRVLAAQALPHSLGLFYETATEHLGFRRGADEYKIMALAALGEPRFMAPLRAAIRANALGFATDPLVWDELAPRRGVGDPVEPRHADLAASVQLRLEEVVLELARALHTETRAPRLAMAGGVALNCVANARLAREGPFAEIFVQPAAGDAGTALGAALYTAHRLGDKVQPMTTAALGSGWSDDAIEAMLQRLQIRYERPDDLAESVADLLAEDCVIGWFQGRSEFGPRALGHRSLLADPRRAENLDRLNEIKGRESFRPVAPIVRLERAPEIADGVLPSPYMLFTHRIRGAWRERIPAAVHVDGSARVQTVDPAEEPELAALLCAFERRTGVPVLVNTSFNTAGRPMVDAPADALECLGSAAIDALAIGPFLVRARVPR